MYNLATACFKVPPHSGANIVYPLQDESATKTDGTTEANRVKNVISKWNPTECRRIDRDASQVDTAEKKEDYAFIFRKTQDERDKFWYSEVEIKSPALQKLLHKNLMHYPGHYWDGDVVTMIDPFSPIVHNWDVLTTVANDESADLTKEQKQACSDLKLLLNIISTSSGVDNLGKYFKERNQHLNNKTITYEALWTLFPPGCRVYAAPFMKQEQIFIVGSASLDFPDNSTRRPRPWSVSCWGYDWNGETFDRRSYEFEFEKFVGSKAINTLPCYPLEYYKDGNEDEIKALENTLEERGRKFRELCIAERGKQMFSYSGKVLYRGIGISTIDSATQVTQVYDSTVHLLGIRDNTREFSDSVQVNDDDDRTYITSSTEELGESTRRKLTRLMSCDVSICPPQKLRPLIVYPRRSKMVLLW